MKTTLKTTSILGILFTAAVLIGSATKASAQDRNYPNNRIPTKRIGDIDSNEVFMGNPLKRPEPPAVRAPLARQNPALNKRTPVLNYSNAALNAALADAFKR